MTGWNPYWLAFAAHRGVDPDDESLHGWHVIPWIHARWAEFDALNGTDAEHARTPAEHERFAAWLDARKTSLAATTAATTGPARPLAGGAGHPSTTKEHTP